MSSSFAVASQARVVTAFLGCEGGAAIAVRSSIPLLILRKEDAIPRTLEKREQPSSAAAAALSDKQLRQTNIAAAVGLYVHFYHPIQGGATLSAMSRGSLSVG